LSCVCDGQRLRGHVAHGFRLLMPHDRKQEMVLHTHSSITQGVNDRFTLNDVALVDRLRYNLLSVSQLCDADLSVLFHKSNSLVLDSSAKRVCGISRIGNVFQADFSYVQSSLRCLILSLLPSYESDIGD
jgi:hypothetical protein